MTDGRQEEWVRVRVAGGGRRNGGLGVRGIVGHYTWRVSVDSVQVPLLRLCCVLSYGAPVQPCTPSTYGGGYRCLTGGGTWLEGVLGVAAGVWLLGVTAEG